MPEYRTDSQGRRWLINLQRSGFLGCAEPERFGLPASWGPCVSLQGQDATIQPGSVTTFPADWPDPRLAGQTLTGEEVARIKAGAEFAPTMITEDARGFDPMASQLMSTASQLTFRQPIGSVPIVSGDQGLPGTGGGPGGLVPIGVSYCKQLGIPDILCDAAGQLIGGQQGGSKQTLQSCPEGYRFDPDSQNCVRTGVKGSMQRLLPGGESGVMEFGQAVVGAFGKPALQPAVVGQVTDARGVTNPILRCPTGMVLGKDNLCYPKPLARQYRKWPPKARPPMSAADAKALRRIGTLQKRVKRLAGAAGFTTAKKGARRSAPRRHTHGPGCGCGKCRG